MRSWSFCYSSHRKHKINIPFQTHMFDNILSVLQVNYFRGKIESRKKIFIQLVFSHSFRHKWPWIHKTYQALRTADNILFYLFKVLNGYVFKILTYSFYGCFLCTDWCTSTRGLHVYSMCKVRHTDSENNCHVKSSWVSTCSCWFIVR